MAECAFYVVADSRFFLGVAALINSLRLVGHDEPVVVVDNGLEDVQRELLAREATLLPAPETDHPVYLRWIAPLEHPAEVMVLLDADVIVVRSLAPLVRLAATGKLAAFVDLAPDRFDEGWADLLGVATLPRRSYVNGGFLALPRARGLELLGLLERIQAELPLELVRSDGSRPFLFREQDVLNAVLAAHWPGEDVAALERRLAPAPPFYGLSVVDAHTLECRFRDGERPYLLHHINEKPWLTLTHPTPYSQLLPRLLLADDLAIRLAPADVSFRLRPGLLPGALRALLMLRWLATKSRFKLRLLLGLSRTDSGSGS